MITWYCKSESIDVCHIRSNSFITIYDLPLKEMMNSKVIIIKNLLRMAFYLIKQTLTFLKTISIICNGNTGQTRLIQSQRIK